jgi:hypothetical protein
MFSSTFISKRNQANQISNYLPVKSMALITIRSSYRTYMLWFLLMAGNTFLSAQSKFSLTGGWGYYELINIGVQWNINEISSLSLYGGTNLFISDNRSWTAGLSFDQTFKRPIVWKLKPGYSLGLLYWTSDDDLYYFRNISFPAMALLAYPLSRSLTVKAEGGVIFTSVLESDRKQNVEAGYPQRFNGNVRLSIIYKLGVK